MTTDRMEASALDRWITREPDYSDETSIRCACGRFLKGEPDYVREWVNVERCDGQPKVIECKYGDSASDEGILQIVGEEHRGETYRLAFPPACGSMHGSGHATYDGEVSPDDAEKWRHEPHWFVPDWGYQQVAVRVCSCGCVNEEVLS